MFYWLLLIAILINLAYNETYVKGVSKSMMSLYQNRDNRFSCLDRSRTIPYKYVNDDYCDCPDASDEPGSSACNNGVFVCRNIGYREHTILSIDVNDGTCNCCDGLDEEPGVCPNTCAQLAEEERQKRLALINKIQTGKSKIYEFLAKVDEFTNLIKNKTTQEELNLEINLKLTKENAESREHVSKQLEHAKSIVLEQWNKNVRIEFANKVFEKIDLNGDKFISNEEILASGVTQYFQINDLVVLSTDGPIPIHAFTDFWISHLEIQIVTEDVSKIEAQKDRDEDGHDDIEVTDDNDEADDNDEGEQEKTQETDSPHKITETYEDDGEVEREYGEDGMEVRKVRPSRHHPKARHRHHPSNEEIKHRNEFQEIHQNYQKELNNPKNEEITNLSNILDDIIKKGKELLESHKHISRELKRLNSFYTIDFGPEKAYMMLFDICFTKPFHHFNYTICPFYLGFQQDSYERHIMGYWNNWSHDPSPYAKMLFNDGDICYGDTQRSFEVILACGEDNNIAMIEEIRTCHYLVDIKTPAACVSVPVPEIRDEL